MWVCLYNVFGCDKQELEQQCLDSSELTDGGRAKATFHPGGEFEQEIPAVGIETDSVSMIVCVACAFRTRLTDLSVSSEILLAKPCR